MAIIYISLTFYNGNADIWIHDFGKNYIIFFINAIIASLLLFNLCRKIKINRVVVLLSTGTLVILGLHDPILQILSLIIQTCYLLNSIIVMCICYFAIKLILKYCPIILGKK